MTHERWITFSKSTQLLHIGSEFERARIGAEQHAPESARLMLERALALIDLTLQDKKWRTEIRMLLGLRDEVAKAYCGEKNTPIGKLYQLL